MKSFIKLSVLGLSFILITSLLFLAPTCPLTKQEAGHCNDGKDNDEDGKTDCADREDCATDPACIESDCEDGVDNDGDKYIDCKDYDCAESDKCEMKDSTCKDGIDNDGNGYTDCEDFGCIFNCNVTVCDSVNNQENTLAECSDGVDNDGDSYTDCKDWSCSRNVCSDVRAACNQ